MNKCKKYPCVLSIAGSDSGGCAGIQADLRVLNALYCHGSTAITTITAQNTIGVQMVEPLTTDIVKQQIYSVLTDIGADVIKIGMLYHEKIIKAVAEVCKEYPSIPIILDPVCVATSGGNLLKQQALDILIKELIPLSTLITPNQHEVNLLLSMADKDFDNQNQENILNILGCKACLITGGDSKESYVVDKLYFNQPTERLIFSNTRIESNNTHGSGCSLSTAISAFIAKGFKLVDAIEKAIVFIRSGIKTGANYKLGQGSGPLCFNLESS